MSNSADRIEDEALQLSMNRRAGLARRLLESLDEEAVEDPEAVARAWETEIERRLARYRAGESGPPLPASAVFKEARERLQNRP
jgi:putative addiction module component (TIGR02574 family)